MIRRASPLLIALLVSLAAACSDGKPRRHHVDEEASATATADLDELRRKAIEANERLRAPDSSLPYVIGGEKKKRELQEALDKARASSSTTAIERPRPPSRPCGCTASDPLCDCL